MESEPFSTNAERSRQVYLPLLNIENCDVCNKTSQDAKLRLCTACCEILYCSTECQQKDWKRHKIQCGKTDRVDIQSLYPLLALLAQACHMHPDLIPHPALTHKILNSPNPGNGDPPVKLPNGISSKLLLLGEKFVVQSRADLEEWWPTGASARVRNKLMRRIADEGHLVPIYLAICIAFVSEMYTTTADTRRVRLCYGVSPISDFGIVQGSLRVKPCNRLAYWDMEKDQFLLGQDPNDHYRIYFKTLSGDEYYLDLGMFTFNFSFMVDVTAYRNADLPVISLAPAHFHGKEFDKTGVDALFFKPQRRHSILRDSRIHQFVCSTEIDDDLDRDHPIVCAIMDEIAGRKCTDLEKDDTMMFMAQVVYVMRNTVARRDYINFPKSPQIHMDVDPDQLDIIKDDPQGESGEVARLLTKWTNKLRKGKISRERWEAGFRTWANKPHEARMKMANA